MKKNLYARFSNHPFKIFHVFQDELLMFQWLIKPRDYRWCGDDGWKMSMTEIKSALYECGDEGYPSLVSKTTRAGQSCSSLANDMTALSELISLDFPHPWSIKPSTHTEAIHIPRGASGAGSGRHLSIIELPTIDMGSDDWTLKRISCQIWFTPFNKLMGKVNYSKLHNSFLQNITPMHSARRVHLSKTFELVLRLWKLQMHGGPIAHAIHI